MSQPAKIRQLIHSGVLIPTYEPKGFTIRYKGKKLSLTPDQEEMAVAWVKKLGTDYVKDPVFVKNFVKDFSKALGVETSQIEDFDFSEIQRWVEGEKAKKESMSREEKKKLAEARKKIREANKEKYGHAILNGERVEIGYTVEPAGIFMGRGKHPLRGRWKPKVTYNDVILNLSPDAPTPTPPSGGHWKERVFDLNAMWIAKWKDKLGGELKYLWVADTARFKQEREIEKFNRACELEGLVEQVRWHIEAGLSSGDLAQRKIATVCYLIDNLKLRVGDEKDKDEANTVGATTLRGAHVKIDSTGKVKFDFIGKDYVRWVKTIDPPTQVVSNLQSFIGKPRAQIFPEVHSAKVNEFLGKVMPGLTAKVFRTYHASKVVQGYLVNSKVQPKDQNFKKEYAATMANLEAAITCNHKRKLPKNWRESIAKKVERLKILERRLAELKEKHRGLEGEQTKKFREKLERRKERLQTLKGKLNEPRKKRRTPSLVEHMRKLMKRIAQETKRIKSSRREFRERRKRRVASHRDRIKRAQERIKAARVKLKLAKATKNYNLGTSLKSYIDPRLYIEWAEKVSYDWEKIYPKTLQQKFAWAAGTPESESSEEIS